MIELKKPLVQSKLTVNNLRYGIPDNDDVIFIKKIIEENKDIWENINVDKKTCHPSYPLDSMLCLIIYSFQRNIRVAKEIAEMVQFHQKLNMLMMV